MNKLPDPYLLLLVLIPAAILMPGCSQEEKPPADLLPEQTYVDLMVELQLVKTYAKALPSDAVNVDSLTQAVFTKYDVTRQQFRSSHQYYQDDVAAQKERISRAIDQLRMEMAKLQDMTGEPADTLNEREIRTRN